MILHIIHDGKFIENGIELFEKVLCIGKNK